MPDNLISDFLSMCIVQVEHETMPMERELYSQHLRASLPLTLSALSSIGVSETALSVEPRDVI